MNNNDKIKKFLNKIGESKDSVGIITSVFDNVPNFLHNSFGEYFAARYLSREYGKFNDLSCFIFEEAYKNIRFLFDSILAKNCPAHLATLHKNIHSLKKCNEDLLTRKDGGGRNPLHLACSWGKTYPVINSANRNQIYYHKELVKENPDQRDILKHLLKHCYPEENDEVYKFNAFSYADRSLRFFALGYIHENHSVPLQDLQNYNAPNLLYYSAVCDFDKILLEVNQASHVVSIQNEPLLSVAARHGSLKCCKLLVTSDEDILTKFRFSYDDATMPLYLAVILDDMSPLHEACRNGQIHVVEFFLEVGNIIDFVLENGRKLLELACWNDHADVTRLLLSKGVDINAVDAADFTLLHLSAETRNAVAAKLLLDEGADVNIVDWKRQSPLHLACKNRNDDIAKLLIEKDCNIDIIDHKGQSALHLACESKLDNVAKLLIHRNVDVNIVDIFGQTALHMACRYKCDDIATLLIKRNAKINIVDQFGQTPLHLACKYKLENVAKLLIEHNADINIGGNFTALHAAIYYECDDIAKLIIEKNTNLDAVFIHGGTPLHFACMGRRDVVAKLLIEKHANIHITNSKGQTALHLACMNSLTDVANLLIAKGADVNIIDNDLQSPLQLAQKNRIIDKLNLFNVNK